MERELYVVTFESTQYAIMAEKKLKEKYKINIIPTPREITASCGLSIIFPPENLEDIKEEIKGDIPENQVGIYRIFHDGNRRQTERVY